MPCTARSPTAPPPSYQEAPSPRPPSRWLEVPKGTEQTARSSCAMPRSTVAGNIRSAYVCSSATTPPGSRFSVSNYSSIMRPDDLIMVSVDDHLVEPPTMFDGRLPQRYQDLAPRVERLADGSDVWTFNGARIPNIGLNAVAGRPKEE